MKASSLSLKIKLKSMQQISLVIFFIVPQTYFLVRAVSTNHAQFIVIQMFCFTFSLNFPIPFSVDMLANFSLR